MTVKELKIELKKEKYGAQGNKDELTKRLQEATGIGGKQ